MAMATVMAMAMANFANSELISTMKMKIIYNISYILGMTGVS